MSSAPSPAERIKARDQVLALYAAADLAPAASDERAALMREAGALANRVRQQEQAIIALELEARQRKERARQQSKRLIQRNARHG